MKLINHNKYFLVILVIFSTLHFSCEKSLEEKTYDRFSSSTFFQNEEDVKSAVTASYSGMLNSNYYGGGWGAANEGWVAQSSFTTDELICSWGWDGWQKFNQLNFSEDFSQLLNHYNGLMPVITNITINLEKIQAVKMDETRKNRYLAELKALRAHYSWILYNFYGPVPIRIDAKLAEDPSAAPIPRPDQQWMVAQIEKDYKDAFAVLPKASELAASDYGRFTKDACLAGLMKLYMHEKNWKEVISNGNLLKTYGHDLQKNYADIFSFANKGNSQEVILAIPCRFDAGNNNNLWLAMCMPGNYVDPNGLSITQWGGYKMPWKTYNKFDPNDKRLGVLLAKWPTDGGVIFDAKAHNYIGAIPMKYGPDPGAISEQQGTDIVVWRYADVLLMMAEAINEDQGPVQAAYDLINTVRNRAGVSPIPTGLSKDGFRSKIMDERLFELWCEGSRREDMIRWGTYIQHAKDEGSQFAKPEFVLYPLPRKVINETRGVVKQNNGY